VTHTPRAI